MGLSNVSASHSAKMVDSLEVREFISKSKLNAFQKMWNNLIGDIASSLKFRSFSENTLGEMKTRIQDSAKSVIKNEKLDLDNFNEEAELHAKFVADSLWKECTGKPLPRSMNRDGKDYAALRDTVFRAMLGAVKEIRSENEILAQKETSENTAPREENPLPEHLQSLVNDTESVIDDEMSEVIKDVKESMREIELREQRGLARLDRADDIFGDNLGKLIAKENKAFEDVYSEIDSVSENTSSKQSKSEVSQVSRNITESNDDDLTLDDEDLEDMDLYKLALEMSTRSMEDRISGKPREYEFVLDKLKKKEEEFIHGDPTEFFNKINNMNQGSLDTVLLEMNSDMVQFENSLPSHSRDRSDGVVERTEEN